MWDLAIQLLCQSTNELINNLTICFASGMMNTNLLAKTSTLSFRSLSNPRILLSHFNATNDIFLRHASSASQSFPRRPKSFRNARQDYGIVSKFVQIVPPEGSSSKTLSPPQLLKSVLQDIDQNTHTLVQVAEKSAEGSHPLAVIMSKTQFRLLAKQEKEDAKNNRDQPDNLFTSTQLTWGITQHDLAHKLKKCSSILAKGGSAEIEVRFKKGTRPPSLEDRDAFVVGIKNALNVPVIEYKPRANMGGATRLFYKGELKAK